MSRFAVVTRGTSPCSACHRGWPRPASDWVAPRLALAGLHGQRSPNPIDGRIAGTETAMLPSFHYPQQRWINSESYRLGDRYSRASIEGHVWVLNMRKAAIFYLAAVNCANAADPAVVSGIPVHSAALIQRAIDYTTGYVAGVNRTVEAGLAGKYLDWNPLGHRLCGTTSDVWTNGCQAGVYNAARWETSSLTYNGPAEWLDNYDSAVTGRQMDCGNGAGPANDGCAVGNQARRMKR